VLSSEDFTGGVDDPVEPPIVENAPPTELPAEPPPTVTATPPTPTSPGRSSGGGNSRPDGGNGSGDDSGQTTRKAPPPPPATFVTLGGEDCQHTSYRGYYVEGSGTTKKPGGYRGDGCKGTFRVVPMSGSTSRDNRYVVWWFKTGAVFQGRCGIAVYVPKGSRSADVAGRPTHYQVIRSAENHTVTGRFSIDQTAARGRWVSVGSFGMSGGKIAIKMLNRGRGSGDTRHGAAQVKISCKSS
jgi:translation initiation factor IF-2